VPFCFTVFGDIELRFLKVIFWVYDRALEVWTPPVLVGMENIEVSWLIFL
jgi:hypothetical protein